MYHIKELEQNSELTIEELNEKFGQARIKAFLYFDDWYNSGRGNIVDNLNEDAQEILTKWDFENLFIWWENPTDTSILKYDLTAYYEFFGGEADIMDKAISSIYPAKKDRALFWTKRVYKEDYKNHLEEFENGNIIRLLEELIEDGVLETTNIKDILEEAGH